MDAGTPEFVAVAEVPQLGVTGDIGDPQASVMAEAGASRKTKGKSRDFLMADLPRQ